MIEINVRVRIDTNDPREALDELMHVFGETMHDVAVSDYWLQDGSPIPKTVARATKILYDRRAERSLAAAICNALGMDVPDIRGYALPDDSIPTHPKSDVVESMLAMNGLILDGIQPKVDALPNHTRTPRDFDQDIDNLSGCEYNSEVTQVCNPSHPFPWATPKEILRTEWFDVVEWKWITYNPLSGKEEPSDSTNDLHPVVHMHRRFDHRG